MAVIVRMFSGNVQDLLPHSPGMRDQSLSRHQPPLGRHARLPLLTAEWGYTTLRAPFWDDSKGPPVIDLYTWTTPNGRKISIALEEMGLPYTVHAVDIGKDEQFKPEFLKISPNNRIPAIVDRDNGLSLMESGAILIYLADKTGKLLPKTGEKRYRVIEWLMWQMGGPGPMLGQVHHFVKYNKGKAPYAEERYLKEAHRLYSVLNTRLAEREFVVDEYSIADIAIWPWISRFEWQTIDLNQYPNVKRWYVTIAKRPAVERGYAIPKKVNEIPIPA
jgi:GSH-dependent disulfide-bond oxidoreductase